MKKSHSLSSKLMSVVGALLILIASVFIGVSYVLLDRTEKEIDQHVNNEVIEQQNHEQDPFNFLRITIKD